MAWHGTAYTALRRRQRPFAAGCVHKPLRAASAAGGTIAEGPAPLPVLSYPASSILSSVQYPVQRPKSLFPPRPRRPATSCTSRCSPFGRRSPCFGRNTVYLYLVADNRPAVFISRTGTLSWYSCPAPRSDPRLAGRRSI